jgi:hypothetical protein
VVQVEGFGNFGVGIVPGVVACAVIVCAGVGWLAILVLDRSIPKVVVQGKLIAMPTGWLASVGPVNTKGPVGGGLVGLTSPACFAVPGGCGLPGGGARSLPGAWRFLAFFPRMCGFYYPLFPHYLGSG